MISHRAIKGLETLVFHLATWGLYLYFKAPVAQRSNQLG